MADPQRFPGGIAGGSLGSADPAWQINAAGNATVAQLAVTKINSYGGVQAQGAGVPAIVAYGRSTAQAAAVAAVTSYIPSADGSFEISGNILVTTASSHAFTMTCTYTDEGGTVRTTTMTALLVAGSGLTTSIANGNGTVPYHGLPIHIRAKANGSIIVGTTGSFTTVVYNVEAAIRQLA